MNDIRNGIYSTASALGIDPLDLATAISYETAGTFDPTKAGPTTQWGQHRGLIQFGEPQARQYGVNWDDPIGSQLGENGAVAKYLRDTGVKPGMGLLDIYSAINAGGVGRYNASDATNGGAPGSVYDKVMGQMGDHRTKAAGFLGVDHSQPRRTGQHSSDPNYTRSDMANGASMIQALLREAGVGPQVGTQPQPAPMNTQQMQASIFTNALAPKAQKQDPRNFLNKLSFGA
jgi:hypothetical protein